MHWDRCCDMEIHWMQESWSLKTWGTHGRTCKEEPRWLGSEIVIPQTNKRRWQSDSMWKEMEGDLTVQTVRHDQWLAFSSKAMGSPWGLYEEKWQDQTSTFERLLWWRWEGFTLTDVQRTCIPQNSCVGHLIPRSHSNGVWRWGLWEVISIG
jgi:hypothetical protein